MVLRGGSEMGRPIGPLLAIASASVAAMGAGPYPCRRRTVFQLAAVLGRYFGHDTLFPAVAELVEFALWLPSHGDPLCDGLAPRDRQHGCHWARARTLPGILGLEGVCGA